MSILRKIAGRDALPVWTLPFAAGARMTADKLARILAARWFSGHVELTAFKLDANGVPVALLPKQWDRVIEDLELLQGQLKTMDCSEAEQIEQWRTESVKRLPANAFVWLDEGAAWFHKYQFNRDQFVFHEDGPEEIPMRPGDSDLDLSPPIPRAIEDYFRANGQGETEDLPPPADDLPQRESDELSVWQKLRNIDPPALAAKPELDHRDVRDLLGLEKKEDFWHSQDCEFDAAGIRAKPLDEATQRALSGTELRIWEQFEADIKLDLPSSPQTFLSWCAKNEFSDVLPPAFVTAVLNRNRSFGLTATRDDFERALRQDAWTAREALCWLHGRNPHWFRGDIERELPEQVDLVKRAAVVGKLNLKGTEPTRWIEWAQGKGWPIPAELLAYVGIGQSGDLSLHPCRRYPQAMGVYLTVAELRTRWRLTNNSFLEALAGNKEMRPYKNGEPIHVRRKGMGYEFGFPPDPEPYDEDEPDALAGFRSYDISLVTWVSSLPEDVPLYPLPFVMEYEDNVNPRLKPGLNTPTPEIPKPPNEPLAGLPKSRGSNQCEPRETEINRWLRETWIAEGKPTGTPFFRALKKYQAKKGSPIVEWYSAGESAGIRWKTSNGATGEWKLKTIQTLVSEFRQKDAKGCQEP